MKRRRRKRQKQYFFADLWYGFRRKFGLPAVSESRLLRVRRLDPGCNAAEIVRKEDNDRLKHALYCIAAGVVLAALSCVSAGTGYLTSLPRPDYGEEEEFHLLKTEYRGKEYEIPVTVGSRRYSEEEWETLKQAAYRNVTQEALADNPDWQHISGELTLTEETGIPGITAEWESGDPEIISFDGSLPAIDEAFLPAKTDLYVTIAHEGTEWKTKIEAVRIPSAETPDARIIKQLSDAVSEAEKERTEEELQLPDRYDGEEIRYPGEDGVSPVLFAALGIITAACLVILPEQKRAEKIRERETELIRTYPEIVSMLSVLMGAGKTVRGAWINIEAGYRDMLAQGMEKKAVYEEMTYAVRSFEKGEREEDVYTEFGRRCGLTSYMRLAGLLSSNVKLGSAGLLPLLKAEADQALEERMRNARRYGEEASSKLLAPMMLLLLVVLVLLVAPALMTF